VTVDILVIVSKLSQFFLFSFQLFTHYLVLLFDLELDLFKLEFKLIVGFFLFG